MADDLWIVMQGDPDEGFTLFGTFDDNEAACHWAEVEYSIGDWWVMPLCSPVPDEPEVPEIQAPQYEPEWSDDDPGFAPGAI